MSRVGHNRVLLTRDPAGNARLRDGLVDAGCDVVEVPLVHLVSLEADLPSPGDGDIVVLTSRRAAYEALRRWGPDTLARTRVAVIGSATGRVLGPLKPAFRPARATANDLAALLADHVRGHTVHFPSAERVTGGLEAALGAAGAMVVRTPVYANRLPEGAQARLHSALPVDLVTLASASAARRLARLAPGLTTGVVAIGPSTAAAALAAGLDVVGVAEPPSVGGLLAATLGALSRSRPPSSPS